MKHVLITGGAGYIGSHICVEMLEQGYGVVVADNFCNSSPEVLRRVEKITGRKVKLYNSDIRDEEMVNQIFAENSIYGVIHMAGLKAVGESIEKPLDYFDNNINGTITLLRAMRKNDVKKMIFSSSATVYGAQEIMPLKEDMPTGVMSPYGRTKLVIEEMLKDLCISDAEWSVVLLRYFNPIGAHESGMIGENPKGIPNNLMPYITQVACGKREELNIFGGDYPTPDGTCLRDYIHVCDLAEGHAVAVRALDTDGLDIYNLGMGKPVSVLELVKIFERVNDLKINFEIVGRRDGDVPICYADAGKARAKLGWTAKRNIEDMCRNSWNWQKKNPDGY